MIAGESRLSIHVLELVQIYLNFGTERSWGALVLPGSDRCFQAGMHMDIHGNIKDYDGQVRSRDITNDSEHVWLAKRRPPLSVEIPSTLSQETKDGKTSETFRFHHNKPYEPINIDHDAPENILQADGGDSKPPVDYSEYQKLDWTNNKENWQKYVKIKQIETDELLTSCDMLQPAVPMRVTPGRDQLQYMFKSQDDMEHILATCAMNENVPAFAIACKSWRSIVSDHDDDSTPKGHICDILTVSGKGRICFWVVVANNDEMDFAHGYLMTTGRMIKHQLVRRGSQKMSQLYIHCGISSTGLLKQTSLEAESEQMQNCLLHIFPKDNDFKIVQRALAAVILSRESRLSRCAADQTSILLSARQAEVLMHRAKVNYISGAAGSGKSWIAAEVYRMHGRNRSVYICTTGAFVQFLEFNGHRGTLIKCDMDLMAEIEKGTFWNKTCIIIDDSHNLSCSKTSMKALFHLLRDTREMALFVFADNDYQSFEKDRQIAMHECIYQLTRDVLKQPLRSLHLTEIYRNTRKVVSFIQSAVQGTEEISHCKIECVHSDDGDGIECITMDNIFSNTTENGLVAYLRSTMLSARYNPPDIALVLDTSHSADSLSQLLRTQMPDVNFQTAADFPRTGIVVDYIDSFLGLDATICIFILPATHGNTESGRSLANARFRVFLASRATYRAVFVVPQIDAELVHTMKFDLFPLVSFTNFCTC